MKEYLSPAQVVEEVLLGYGVDALYKLIQRRQIPHYRLPGKKSRILLRRDEVEKWVESHRVGTFNPRSRR